MQEPILSKTLEGKFEDVFAEVQHDEQLGLMNPNQLRLFCLDVANNAFSYDALREFLIDNIGQYVYSRARMEQFVVDGKAKAIVYRAVQFLNKKGCPGEKGSGADLGEMLIYVFLEHVLGAPKIMSKVELVASGGTYTSKSDAIHLLAVEGEDIPFYQLVFGSSTIEGEIEDAIEDAFKAVAAIHENQQQEKNTLVETSTIYKLVDEETAQKMAEVILPSKNHAPVDNAYGIFIGYSLGLDPTQYSNAQFRIEMQKKMERDIKQHASLIRSKIDELGLQNYSFYIYVLPLNKALEDRQSIMNEIMGGGE